jgi:putative FmdB family regulatory protein
MPIYEYRCSSCGFEEEYLQKVSATPLTDCPKCGKSTFVKKLTAAGFQLKGSGWYATDFKNSGSKAKEAKSSDKSEGTGETKSDTKTEAKSDTKSDTKSETKSETKAADKPSTRSSSSTDSTSTKT